MKRLLPLFLIPILVVWLAATSRPAADIRYGLPGAITTQQRTGAPPLVLFPALPSGLAGFSAAPSKPSGGIDKGFYCSDPPECGYVEPQPLYVAPLARDGRAISGEATWWNTFGGGFYAALRPDLGSKGDLVIVCGGAPFHCRTAPVITSCACLGPSSERLVDLSRDLFSEFADPSRGTVRIVLQVVRD